MKSKRCSYRLEASALAVAELFAAENFSGDDLLVSNTVLGHIRAHRYREMKTLLTEFTRPMFQSVESYYTRKQFAALVAKVPFPGSESARMEAALKALYWAEGKCKRTNKRLRHYLKHPDRMPDDIRVLLSRSRELVRKALGDFSEGKLLEILELARPGSGVCIGTHNKHRVSLPFKLGDTDLCVSDSARPYGRMLVEGSPAWFRLHAEIDWETLSYKVPYVSANSNRITFVEKDACTLRPIAIEPSLNVCLQLGVHEYISNRLERFGNSITDQTRNQNLARIGSELGLFGPCTIDLSSASDTVALEFVRYMLPSGWFSFLDDLRCKTGLVNGNNVNYEKFSSMGNGFTFALETLLFWAMARSATEYCGASADYVSVYGDDIIVPSCVYAILVELLQFCGFAINTEKSFAVGSFRESCGADWYFGHRVTPLYLRTPYLTVFDVHRFHNGIDPVFRVSKCLSYLLDKYKRGFGKLMFGLPNEDPTSCLFTTFDYLKGAGQLRWDPNIQTWKFRVLRLKSVDEPVPPLSGLAASLTRRGGLPPLPILSGRDISGQRGTIRGRVIARVCWSTPGVTQGLSRDRKSVV